MIGITHSPKIKCSTLIRNFHHGEQSAQWPFGLCIFLGRNFPMQTGVGDSVLNGLPPDSLLTKNTKTMTINITYTLLPRSSKYMTVHDARDGVLDCALLLNSNIAVHPMNMTGERRMGHFWRPLEVHADFYRPRSTRGLTWYEKNRTKFSLTKNKFSLH
jgi:hypothetical protein